jgi:uncharacterized protein involved in exopolysaccharide biosynthesis
VDTKELIKEIFKRVQKTKYIIIAAGVAAAVLFVFLFANKPATYTSKATLFPLTSPSDNGISSSMLSGILGLSDAPKSFSSEATINIIELALSRSIREQVAATRLPQFENKTIASLLIKESNDQRSFISKFIEVPKDSIGISVVGGELLKTSINAKMSKNGVLELYFTSTNQSLVSPVSYTLIDKLSVFYIDLKRQKASDDYNFTLGKIDSLQRVINGVDKRAIGIQQSTMFAPPELLEYNIPKNNISAEKSRVVRQRDMFISNRDEALWHLQKVTPIISVLDKPNAPFDIVKPSKILFLLIGFIAGSMLTAFMLLSGLLYRYSKYELHKAVFGN